MSSIESTFNSNPNAYNPTDTYAAQPPPAHHVHHDSEPLPGTRGAAPAPDYDADTTNQSRTWETEISGNPAPTRTTTRSWRAGSTPVQTRRCAIGKALASACSRHHKVAWLSADRLTPEGKAKLTDKLIGKTQKVSHRGHVTDAGKATKNPDMHERGELREAGGKAAAMGEARAPHD
ncbi:hypothetical protein B0H21DRAFT_705844 [Amylocystis lapponica]|nr:hypothetical protein B0H21DRAFT_705844 [Amylocystis lapponica]